MSEIRWFGVVLLVGHLALLGLGAASLWSIGGGGVLGGVAAGIFTLAYAAAWRTWLAPGAKRRLPYRGRFFSTLLVGPTVIVLGALADLWLPALVAMSMTLLGDALNERS